MKSIVTFIAAIAICGLVLANLYAAGGCPNTADRLSEFARCMYQTKNGTVYRGTAFDLDPDNRAIMNAMQQTQVVPPHITGGMSGIINPMFPYASPISFYNPFYYGLPLYSGGRPRVWIGVNPW